MQTPITVFVVDDHSLFRRGLIALIGQDDSLRVVGEAADAGQALRLAPGLRPDVILLDNMTLAELADAVKRIHGRAISEASGGITLETVRAVAETGVNLISVGWLTHSAPTLDVALDFDE